MKKQQPEQSEHFEEVTEESQQETIDRLRKDISTLSDRCARLEAQNILVSVQQLDAFARITAWILSLLSLYIYVRYAVFYSLDQLLLFLRVAIERRYQGADYWFLHVAWSVRSLSWLPSVLGFLVEWTAKLGLGFGFPYWHHHRTFGVTHRRFEVFAVAFVVISRTKLVQWRERMFSKEQLPNSDASSTPLDTSTTNTNTPVPSFGQDTHKDDAIWDANYEISARFLYISILRLQGLWTKTAQYLSSRADFVPPAYIRELSRLQDQAPATAWTEIAPRLSRKVLEQLTGIDPVPLASASIGQVHVAKVRATGEKVVIKVQHPSSQILMTDDFWSLKVIARFVAWMDPEYEFLEILMKEWAKEARHELNFLTEADNLVAAQKSIDALFAIEQNQNTKLNTKAHRVDDNSNSKAAGTSNVIYTNTTSSIPKPVPFQVEIPRPLLEYTSRDVLVMSFCEGFRVDDFERMEQEGLVRDAVMDGVAQTFAHMMYVSDIFNGDPHAGNLLLRAGTTMTSGTTTRRPSTPSSEDEKESAKSMFPTDCSNKGFTLVLLDWGLAKRLPTDKRLAFCQMAYAAATLDFGLLLDSFQTVGLKMKRENVAEDMEGMRFFLRDIVPSGQARRRIKARIKTDAKRRQAKQKGEKIPMDSKAYPGEFFFFVRVNELMHGLGSRMAIEMAYLDVQRPYAERGLQLANSEAPTTIPPVAFKVKDIELNEKLRVAIEDLRDAQKVEGVQVCVIDRNGDYLANLASGTLGGLKKHIPMQENSLVLGYSCTKAVAATVAHVMVKDGYLDYDEPVCQRVWPNFCPTPEPPAGLAAALDLPEETVRQRWAWKREITLRHILMHKAGLSLSMPHTLTIKIMASCEQCVAAYEYHPETPEATILPARAPGEASEYHFMSFGWLVAGTVCGAYQQKHPVTCSTDNISNIAAASVTMKAPTFRQVYEAMLGTKLSRKTKTLGFCPCGGNDNGLFPMAQVVTSDIRASQVIQQQRESQAMGEGIEEPGKSGNGQNEEMLSVMKAFRGKEFLLDSRIWNCHEALSANVPSAGGRFSAMGLAHFYHDLGVSGRILDQETLDRMSAPGATEEMVSALQGATVLSSSDGGSSAGDERRTSLGLGYQLISFDKTAQGFGHAGVGGSIGLYHPDSGLSIALMTNKADGGREVTTTISRVVMQHLNL